jgi:signal peptidase I
MDATAQKPRRPWYVRFVVGSNPLVTLVRAAVWAALLIVLFKFILIGIRVRGASMEPTFHEGQVKFINRLAYMRHPPKRGDVVAIRVPEYNAVIIKRVIALPGEILTVRGGNVYINGQRLEEPYVKGLTGFKSREYKLEANQYWLIGDNRPISEQYLIYDYKIVGKVVL